MNIFKEIVRKVILKFDLGHRLAFFSLSTYSAIRRTKDRETEINTILDIGASDGRWSLSTFKVYSESNYFLIEAQKEHEPALNRIRNKLKNFNYVICAAGDRNGVIQFDSSDLFGGLAVEDSGKSDLVSVPVYTVDEIVKNNNLKGPFLLKLDTHGYEVPIFEGATETLRNTNLIIVETYNFKITKKSLMFGEMCNYLGGKNFRCFDISEPLFRKKDKAFWQIDLFFIPSTSAVFDSEEYE